MKAGLASRSTVAGWRRIACTIVSMLLSTVFACSDGDGAAGSPPFVHRTVDASPATGPDCCTDVCCTGDINGDGYPDIVIGAENAPGPGLVWYEYPTWRRRPVASGQFTTDGRLVDVDGDGDLDIAISNLGTGIFWYENTGEYGPGGWTPHRIGEGYGHDVETGDIDGDGDVDVVTCDKKSVTWWEQGGARGWEPHAVSDRPGEGTALADLDNDGDMDIIHAARWLENTDGKGRGPWVEHEIDPSWYRDTRVVPADMNNDGRTDVVLAVSEAEGRIAWFENPDTAGGSWLRHDIETREMSGVHGLATADFDGDGDTDVAAAEMHTSKRKRVLVYLNDGGGVWRDLQLSREGSHNIRVCDIGADGDFDIVGKNYAGAGRTVEMWENQTAPGNWDYFAVDERRPDSQKWKMGLVFADFDNDGDSDIAAGSCLYVNPGVEDGIRGAWQRTVLDDALDLYFATDVDGDARCDLVGASGTKLVWVEAPGEDGLEWSSHDVATIAEGRTQGYAVASIRTGGRPQLVFTRGKALYYAVIPQRDPGETPWEIVTVSRESEEEGIAAADLDGDGDVDLAGVAKDGHAAVWYPNPGESGAPAGGWPQRIIGPSREWLDRVAVADIDGDGRPDVVATEETQDRDYNAAIYWFRGPERPETGDWTRNTVAVLRSVNSMEVADMDGDGDPDIVAAEHTDNRDERGAPDNLTVVYENRGRGAWIAHPVDISSRSSHLGARLCDLDGDGDLDIVSIAWRQYRYLHVWLNYTDTGNSAPVPSEE